MAKTTRVRASKGSRSRRSWWALLILLSALAAALWLFRAPIAGFTGISTAYSARVACSCHYVAGRAIGDCAKDKLDGMELVTLVANYDAKSVTARFPLLASSTAYYREGYGCVLERWED